MSAALVPVFEETPQRAFPRYPIHVTLDIVALRSGVPENLPGRCTDISEAGLSAVVAGELAAGQPVAVELRLPNVAVPVRARAIVRYHSRLHCGVEFVGLSAQQRGMIRYWVYGSATKPADFREDFRKEDLSKKEEQAGAATPAPPIVALKPVATSKRRIRIGRRGFFALLISTLALAGLGWWQWQRSWNELEAHVQAAESRLQVSPETMEKRIVTKVDPVYPEAARATGTEGLVVLDAAIAPDGSVKSLRPVSGPGLLVPSAAAAVKSWKFEPYLSSGTAVEVETPIAVEFRLN